VGVAVLRVGEFGEGGEDRPGEVLSPRLGTSVWADIFSYNTRMKAHVQKAKEREERPCAGSGIDFEKCSLVWCGAQDTTTSWVLNVAIASM